MIPCQQPAAADAAQTSPIIACAVAQLPARSLASREMRKRQVGLSRASIVCGVLSNGTVTAIVHASHHYLDRLLSCMFVSFTPSLEAYLFMLNNFAIKQAGVTGYLGYPLRFSGYEQNMTVRALSHVSFRFGGGWHDRTSSDDMYSHRTCDNVSCKRRSRDMTRAQANTW